jgi:hypothetical protein
MPPWMQQFVQNHFWLLYAASAAWCVIAMSYMLWRRRIRGPHFPDRRQVTVLYDEKWTSGRSLKSLFTRLCGANNCLRVTVTDQELWVTPHFPFSAFASKFDLDHRVRRGHIANVARNGKTIVVNFAGPDEKTKSVELRLRRPDEFLSAMAEVAVGMKSA